MVWRVWFLVWLFKDLVIGWGNGLNSPANHCTTPTSQDGHDHCTCTTPISQDGHDLS